jgi:hypothetical protein
MRLLVDLTSPVIAYTLAVVRSCEAEMETQTNERRAASPRQFGPKSTPALTVNILGVAFLAFALWVSDYEWSFLHRDPLRLAARVGVIFPHAYVVGLVMVKQIVWPLTVRDLYVVGVTYFFGSLWTSFVGLSL